MKSLYKFKISPSLRFCNTVRACALSARINTNSATVRSYFCLSDSDSDSKSDLIVKNFKNICSVTSVTDNT